MEYAFAVVALVIFFGTLVWVISASNKEYPSVYTTENIEPKVSEPTLLTNPKEVEEGESHRRCINSFLGYIAVDSALEGLGFDWDY